MPKGVQDSAVADAESRSVSTYNAGSVVSKKDVTAGTKSASVAVPGTMSVRKNGNEKAKSAVVSKTTDAVVEGFQIVSDVAKSTTTEASRQSGNSKKKKLVVKAAASTDDKSSVQVSETIQTSDGSSSLLVTNETSPAQIKAKNKHKSSKARNKAKDAKKKADELEKGTMELLIVGSGTNSQVLKPQVHDQPDDATTAEKSNSIFVERSTTVVDASRAPDSSSIEALELNPFPPLEASTLKQIEPTAPTHERNDSTTGSLEAVQDIEVRRTRPTASHKRIAGYVSNLGLPGISFDKFGVRIASDAPDWVRGRIARRVWWLVSDLEEGKAPAVIDIAAELEIEKKEKLHFCPVVWDRLFTIEDRSNPMSQEEILGYLPLIWEFDRKLAAGPFPDSSSALVADGAGNQERLAEVEYNSSFVPPLNAAAPSTLSHKQAKHSQQGRGSKKTAVAPLEPQSHSQASLAPQATVFVPQNSVIANTIGDSNLAPSIFSPFSGTYSLHQGNQKTQQHSQDPSRRLCHYFAEGFCYHGDDCQFYHPKAGSDEADSREHAQNPMHPRRIISRQACRLYANGKCHYGPACRYTHDDRGRIQAVAEPYQQESMYEALGSSRSMSRSSNNRSMASRLEGYSNGQALSSGAYSPGVRMSGNLQAGARLTPDSHGSTQGSMQSLFRSSPRNPRSKKADQKKKMENKDKSGAKNKGGKKS